ncbi:hypothetical protein [Legionella jamestowniensis]|uniref:Uncharacterized protein n=1 Tax=Legionella jamestowniensis TaxID=455 RepID=A0A0W0UNC7_9GAMM|nr:hypothetical protein [Legionella jamestowniensis]KTD09377.1 hypothetical protein Ljam_0727 [Legionella jamestowniensis]OCH99204.1 hypothetical protein A8135_08140 [Legionella jamestowniensis]SFL88350.1 hypothetical protein SAMN02746073_2397 [Legionella jamestowniensis DSM 19215]
MKLSNNPFIREIKREANGHYLIFIHPQKRMALSSFFFQDGIEGHYKEDRYEIENLLEIFDEDTMKIYIDCHRSLPEELKKELRQAISLLSETSDSNENNFQGFSKSHFTSDFVNGLTEWFNTVHKTIGSSALPKLNISNLFYDIFEVIIPAEKRKSEVKTDMHFKPVMVQPIVEYNTYKIKYPEIEQYIGISYITLRQFENAYIELDRFPKSSRSKIIASPEDYLNSWPYLFKGAESIFVINKWVDHLVQNQINPVSKEQFSSSELQKLKELQQTSNEFTEKICTLMQGLFDFYQLPNVRFDLSINHQFT